MTDSKRLIDLLAATDTFFKSRGIEAPRRNAEALFAMALKIPRIELYLQHDRPLKEDELSQIRELIRRRAKREPLQYLVGEVEFCGAQIFLSPGLLIPRPETEELVEALIKRIPAGARVLDIGCGTGCIAIAIAMRLQSCTVAAVDFDSDACDQTAFNANANGVAGRVTIMQADMFELGFVNKVGTGYDVVVSNPPYLRNDELPTLEPEVRDHERKHALVSGPKGDECFARIAECLPELLKPCGIFALEFGVFQESRILELFTPLLTELDLCSDMQGKQRYLIGSR